MGLAHGFLYLPAVTSPSYFFKKRQALATGIAYCGSGFGFSILPPVTSSINYYFGWDYVIIFNAALLTSLIPLICVLPNGKVMEERQLDPTLLLRDLQKDFIKVMFKGWPKMLIKVVIMRVTIVRC